jgi:anti-anti-sigma factor
MGVKLIQVGEFGNREIPIDVDEFNIGRDFTCDLRIDHGRIARNHCRILKRDNRVLVEALHSKMGTAINRQILDPASPPVEAHDGDHLWVGPEHFQFVIPTGPNDPGRSVPEQGKANDDEGLSNPLLEDIRTVQSRLAHKVLERLVTKEGSEELPVSPESEPEPSPRSKGHLDVTHTEGVTVVRLRPKAILADNDIRNISEELKELIDSGQNCIALHLGNVERLSSQVIGEVLQVYRRCKAKGGILKICEVTPEVADVFAMTNMQRHIEIFPDERLALKSAWPKPTRAAPREPQLDERQASSAPAPAGQSSRVRLIVDAGRAKGQAVQINNPRFLIGRDQQCQLRPNSNAISRLHTAIEQREGRVFVRDLGSRSGTILNGRVLRNEESEVSHGDRLQIGTLQFSFALESQSGAPAPLTEEESLSWLLGEHKTDASAATTIARLPDVPTPFTRPPVTPATNPPVTTSKKLRYITHEIVQNIDVVTLLTPDLSEEATLSRVRTELESIVDQPEQHRVVLRFDNVRSLSRGAVVMLLARAQHLSRTQGAMRLCHVSPTVMSSLEQTQLPQLIEILPKLEEALHTSWE